jgi:opacity protein-like surface antigen
MKKILFLFVFVFAVSSLSQAQNIFKPSLDLIARGNYSVWLSDSTFKNYYKAFPGIQLELAYNLSPQFSIYGTFSSDFIAPKERKFSIPGYSATESNSLVLAFYAGPRYNIVIPGNKNIKPYIDAGIGFYSLKFGDYKETQSTNPPATINYKYKSISQFGFNFGGGLNMDLNDATFLNFNVKYHNVPKKNNVVIRETATITTTENGTTTTTTITSALDPVNVPSRSTFQFGIGIGFKFGL